MICTSCEDRAKIPNSEILEKSNHGIITVDKCLEDLIILLNRAGVKTLGACCGHGKNKGGILISLDSLVFFNLGEELRVELVMPRAKDLKKKGLVE